MEFIKYTSILEAVHDLSQEFPCISKYSIHSRIKSLSRVINARNNDNCLIKHKGIPWLLTSNDSLTKEKAIIPFFADTFYGQSVYKSLCLELFTEELPEHFKIPFLYKKDLPETFEDFIRNYVDSKSNLYRNFYGEKSSRLKYTKINIENNSYYKDLSFLLATLEDISHEHDLKFKQHHEDVDSIEYLANISLDAYPGYSYITSNLLGHIYTPSLINRDCSGTCGFYGYFKIPNFILDDRVTTEVVAEKIGFLSHPDLKTFFLAGYLHSALIKEELYSTETPGTHIMNLGVNHFDVANYKDIFNVRYQSILGISYNNFLDSYSDEVRGDASE